MIPVLINGPALEPVTLAEAKAWLRVDVNDEDDLISALITSARLIVESTARRMLLTQTWRLVMDAWPEGGVVKIPFSPFQALNAVRVYDINNVAQLVAPASYVLTPSPYGARLVFIGMAPVPGRPFAGIEIDIVLGFGDAAGTVAAPLRRAILILVARWYENRGDGEGEAAFKALPGAVDALIAPYRRVRVS